MRPSWPAKAYWICQFGGWGSWTLANAILYASSTQKNGVKGPLTAMWMGAAGLAVSHAMRMWMKRGRWTEQGVPLLVARVAALTAVATLAVMAVNLLAMIYLFRWYTWSETTVSGYVGSSFIWMAVLLSWQAIYFAAHWFARSRRAETEALRLDLAAREASLLALRSQLNPHFLFNCLNSIRALIAADPARAQEAVTTLASLLRYTLQSGERADVALKEELEMVDEYLALEKIRFEERLQVRRDVEEEALAGRIPPMLAQLMVENALKHGIAARTGGGEVRIEAALEDGLLRLRVTNPGRIVVTEGRTGIGLRNARQRLELRYGARAGLELREEAGTVVAEARIPQ